MRKPSLIGLRYGMIVILVIGLLVGFTDWRFTDQSVKAASTGTTGLLTIQGSGASTAFGDFVSDADALNTSYHYFIEVPPGLSRLKIDIFDADVGLGGAAEAAAGRDRDRNGFDSSVRYTLLNPSGQSRPIQFITGDDTGPVGSDNNWLALFDSTGDFVRDNFAAAAYANNNGLINWSTNWIETNDDNNAAAGLIQITGGELRIQDNGDGSPSTIQREVNLSGFSAATLSFDFRTTNVEANDSTLVQISNNGGGAWTTLESFTGAFAATSRNYDITSSIAANTRVRFITNGIGFTGNDAFFVDNVQIKNPTIAAGHWEVRVDMSALATTGDDINAFGIRAHDGDANAGGTELNIYADSFYAVGVNPPGSGTTSRSYTMYPYVSSGCSCSKNDFDFDSTSGDVGSLSLSSRTGVFTQNYASANLSANDTWDRDTFSGWTSDSVSDEYGVWTTTSVIKSYLVSGTPNGNLASLYFGNFQAAANPPAANPAGNALRIYLPNDAGTAPSKPYLDQRVIGPGLILVGQTANVIIWLQVFNPTSQAITFSASNLVTANVPGPIANVRFAGHSDVSQGSIVSQPAIGGTGNITWNPGTVAAGGGRAILMYYLSVSFTSAGQRIPVTGTPASGNGTRASFVDETGNTTQARATYQFGPLCELAASASVLLPSSYPPGSCNLPLLPNGSVGQLYDQSVGNFDPTLFAGTLPPGLSIVGTHLTGTPITSGTFNFSLTIGNPGFICITTKAYSLIIDAPTAADGTILGSLTSDSGAPVEGAVVNLSGTESRKKITDANGNYYFDNVETNGFYTITPARVNYIFNPFNRSFSQIGNRTEAAFAARFLGDSLSPLDTPEYFVRQEYLDVLGREPDEAGFNYWSDQILACGDDAQCVNTRRRDVAAAFFMAHEFQASGSYIYDVYAGALGRRPAYVEYAVDRQQIVGGDTLAAQKEVFALSFVRRAEFVAKYQNAMTAEAFVDALLQNVQSSGTNLSSERDNLIGVYNGGADQTESRAAVVRTMADNPAFKQAQYNQAFVLTQYFAYLRRDPESAGYNFWLNVLNSGAGGNYRSMVCAFITSAEYQHRFSSIVTHSNAECGQ